jgi:hypothetical protein
VLATAVLLCVIVSASARAKLISRPFADRMSDAEVIARGVITGKASRCPDEFPAPRPGTLVTDYTFLGSEVWKGCAQPGDSMVMRLPGGGPCDRQSEIASPVPKFVVGDSLVIFLKGNPGGPKWPIWRDTWQPYPGYATLKGDEAHMAETTDLNDPLPLDQFEHRVREVMRQTQATAGSGGTGAIVGSVAGAVGDSTEQVADARVTVDGRSAVPCDARGAFQLPNLPAGCVRLLFEAGGHRAEAKVLRVWPAWTETLRVVLQPTGPGGH